MSGLNLDLISYSLKSQLDSLVQKLTQRVSRGAPIKGLAFFDWDDTQRIGEGESGQANIMSHENWAVYCSELHSENILPIRLTSRVRVAGESGDVHTIATSSGLASAWFANIFTGSCMPKADAMMIVYKHLEAKGICIPQMTLLDDNPLELLVAQHYQDQGELISAVLVDREPGANKSLAEAREAGCIRELDEVLGLRVVSHAIDGGFFLVLARGRLEVVLQLWLGDSRWVVKGSLRIMKNKQLELILSSLLVHYLSDRRPAVALLANHGDVIQDCLGSCHEFFDGQAVEFEVESARNEYLMRRRVYVRYLIEGQYRALLFFLKLSDQLAGHYSLLAQLEAISDGCVGRPAFAIDVEWLLAPPIEADTVIRELNELILKKQLVVIIGQHNSVERMQANGRFASLLAAEPEFFSRY